MAPDMGLPQRRPDTATDKPVRARNDRQMWDGIVLSTEKLTGKLPLEVIPVGEAFQDIRCGKKTSYGKDPAFDFKNPVYPALPAQDNSLNVGYYWNKDVKYIPEGVSPKFASELKRTASKIFKEHKKQHEHK